MMPPSIIDMRFESPGKKPFHIWLPLFLLWPLVLLVVALGLCLTIPTDFILVVAGQRYHHYSALWLRLFWFLADLNGMVLRIHTATTYADLTFF